MKNYLTTQISKMLKWAMVTILFVAVSPLANAVNCTLNSVTQGWTGVISFTVNEAADLSKNPIQFDISNGAVISSVWNLPGNASVSQEGSKVTVKLEKWWPAGEGYMASAGEIFNMSFSPSVSTFSISNFKIGAVVPEGKVQFVQVGGSDQIPSNTVIKLVPADGNGTTYSFNWTGLNNETVNYGVYNVSASFNDGLQTQIVDASPTLIYVNDASKTQTVSLLYKQNSKTIAIFLNAQKPAGVTSDLTVKIKNTTAVTETTVTVPWMGQTEIRNLTVGNVYTLSATAIPANVNNYTFKFTPAKVTVNTTKSLYNVTATAIATPLPAYDVYVNVSGLPTGVATELTFKPTVTSMESVVIPNVLKGKNVTPYSILKGKYTLSAKSITVGNLVYSAVSKTVTIGKSVTIGLVCTSKPKEVAKKQIIGYFPQWDVWKAENCGLTIGVCNQLNVAISKYTMINFAFFGVAKDGSFHNGDYRNKDTAADQEPAPLVYDDIYSSFDNALLFGKTKFYYSWDSYLSTIGYTGDWQGWKKTSTGETGVYPLLEGEPGAIGIIDLCKEKNVKVMASIGGWSMCKHYSDVANDPVKRATFVNECKKLIAMGFDGIDIDWEYPGPLSGMNFTGKEYDYQNFAILMKEIRAAIGSDKLLTACFSCVPEKLAGFDFQELDKYLNYYNIMTYDMEGGWSDYAGINSALYDSNPAKWSWDRAFKYLIGRGVAAEKINMGIPFYGRGVETQGPAALGAPTYKTWKTYYTDGLLLNAGDWTNFEGFESAPFYSYIVNNTADWTEHWDANTQTPYRTKSNFFLTYENPQSITLKCQYVKDNNAAGVIIWEVFGDMMVSGGTSGLAKLPKAGSVTNPLLDTVTSTLNQ